MIAKSMNFPLRSFDNAIIIHENSQFPLHSSENPRLLIFYSIFAMSQIIYSKPS